MQQLSVGALNPKKVPPGRGTHYNQKFRQQDEEHWQAGKARAIRQTIGQPKSDKVRSLNSPFLLYDPLIVIANRNCKSGRS